MEQKSRIATEPEVESAADNGDDQGVTLPLWQVLAIRNYLGSRPFDEVAAAVVWIENALKPQTEKQ